LPGRIREDIPEEVSFDLALKDKPEFSRPKKKKKKEKSGGK
jgi:hypothetical protein